MSDRHPKWVRVEPGTVIPAGQPYRFENGEGFAFENVGSGLKSGSADPGEWFVDSSWKPPLLLPTEPTWGIVIRQGGPDVARVALGRDALFGGKGFGFVRAEYILDFIPLTDEQVARIEAAR